MITERTLKKWRRSALLVQWAYGERSKDHMSGDELKMLELARYVIQMTQDLLDEHLMKGK